MTPVDDSAPGPRSWGERQGARLGLWLADRVVIPLWQTRLGRPWLRRRIRRHLRREHPSWSLSKVAAQAAIIAAPENDMRR